ncbi:MAG: hypothetical protein PWQ27_660 [Kosmotoga sp.]|nr:hypothetical protein [Kosmotoga sp.]
MKVGILLSGCGLGDGTQIEEVMLTYLSLDKYGIDYITFAPNEMQHDVIDHYTEKPQNETRNILIESARIGRGKICDIREVSCKDIDAIIIPGGLGVFKNLSTFIVDKKSFTVNKNVDDLLKAMYLSKKSIAGICGAVILIAKSLSQHVSDLKVATANDAYGELLSELNVNAVNCSAKECVIDRRNKVVTTPAFLASKKMDEIMVGIDKMVKALQELG